ncbi:MAG TPA: PKD domain-containing protein [Tepidisphaeraceae bacterium]|jgi:hypothetical protein
MWPERFLKVFLAILTIPACAANFTSADAPAARFGAHEIVLTGNGSVPNPFQTDATVRFTSPSGKAVTVAVFYDGGNTWRARVYVSETGAWQWASTCNSDPALGGKSGSFTARESSLHGMLHKHKTNPRAWMTDDGRWFANISDTGYRLFHGKVAPDWRQFVQDSADKGVTCIRAASLGGWGGTPGAKVDDNDTWVWNDPWTAGGARPDYTRYDLDKFHTTDARLAWLLDHYPDVQFQFILFGLKGYGSESTGKHWFSIPDAARTDTMRYLIARWSAFPNLFWLIVNDMHCDAKFPTNQAFVREVGTFFAANDPWHHLISTGPNRHGGFPFMTDQDLKWCSYIYIEDANAVAADQIDKFGFDKIPLHVWMGEDYYEQDHGHYKDPRFYFRWLTWSWLLSGGSANYCGRWGPIDPYSLTGNRDRPWEGIDKKTVYTGEQLTGLDSYPYILSYLSDRKLDLSQFQPNDARVSDADGRTGTRRPKLAQRDRDDFLIYHPNAAADSHAAIVDAVKTARLRIDLRDAPGKFQVEWFRPLDGVTKRSDPVEGGAERTLQAPWSGQDVVLWLHKVDSTHPGPLRQPLFRTLDLNRGELQEVELSNGDKVKVKLLDVSETRDSLRSAIRLASVKIEINGTPATIESGNYRLPTTVTGVQVDCPVTRGYYANHDPFEDSWGLVKDARLRLWPKDSPLLEPGTFVYPVRQRWFATATQIGNEPSYVDGGDYPAANRTIYYHSGNDIGGCEGLIDVLSACDGLVVSAAGKPLSDYAGAPFYKPRGDYDYVYVLDDHGWFYRYAHLKSIDPAIQPGTRVRMSQKIGVLGKEGSSGGWSHLHFDIKARQPSGKWGVQDAYPFLWEAWLREHKPDLIAVARPHHLVAAGETITLDGSRSWSSAGKIARYQWTLHDGGTAEGPTVQHTYDRPGSYSEILKVTDAAGHIDYDFAIVQVLDRNQTDKFPPTIHATYAPTFDVHPGDPVTFKVRTFRTDAGNETWDFGDGTDPVNVHSAGSAKEHDPAGYAQTTHRFSKPGHYIVRVQGTGNNAMTAAAHLQVRVTQGTADRE